MSRPILGLDDFEFETYTTRSRKTKKNKIQIIRRVIAFLAVAIISIGGTYTFIEFNKTDNTEEVLAQESAEGDDPLETEQVLGLNSCEDPDSSPLKNVSAWWDEDFNYSSKLKISSNESFDKTRPLKVIFNHQKLVNSEKSKKDGSDLRLVLEVEGNFLQTPYKLVDPNTISTELIFRLNQDYDNPTYYLYHGNQTAQAKSQNISGSLNEESSYSISLENEKQYPIVIKTDRLWALKGYEDKPVNLEVDIDESLKNQQIAVNYEIEDTDFTGAIIPENNEYNTVINVDELESGQYNIRATLSDSCYTITSQPQKINVSYPVFVVWTMDWEGQSVSPRYLDQITEISDRYDVPLTQMFNPRIYITNSISRENINLMDSWVKDRQEKGDEVGLHLHMWYDMIREVGLTPYTSPKWANMNTGYDVLLTSYSENDTDRIIKWALAKMEENGFEDIKSFRAGGWELDTETLAALEKNGIKIDTSGRTNHKMGVNLIPSNWDLSPTQRPYQPSKKDINKQGADHFNLWEFPNNGSESYLYSYEQMRERFDMNYNEKYMNSPQVVTFLSHPHWFNIDYPKMMELFGYINKFNSKNDDGPIVFATLEDSYEYWIKVVE